MLKSEASKFANYMVYEIVDEKIHILCLCEDSRVARAIAVSLAILDKQCDAYYVTSVNCPGDFVLGGGWYDRYQKNKKTGTIQVSSLD